MEAGWSPSLEDQRSGSKVRSAKAKIDGLIMKDEGPGVQRKIQAEVSQPWEDSSPG